MPSESSVPRFPCTYTKHKTQKRKIYQDGVVVQRGKCAVLYDDNGRQIDSAEVTITKDEEDYEFSGFLVVVQQDEEQDCSSSAPPPAKRAARPAFQKPFNACAPLRQSRSAVAGPTSSRADR